jgi:hypothetical protein
LRIADMPAGRACSKSRSRNSSWNGPELREVSNGSTGY